MNSKELTIVIVTFKSERTLFSCLESIPNNIDVIIVENSKNEHFKKNIESKFNNVKCILSGENKGYAVANNLGLRDVTTKYALVLNPDATLEQNTINNFLNTAEEIKNFWLIGPGNDQARQYDFKDKNIIEVNNIRGFAIFFNLKNFEKNFFDENFFLYFEEIDLCERVKKNKGKIFLDKNIIINHKGAKSVEITQKIELEKNRNWHWMWSSFYFHKKHKGFLIALMIIFPKLVSSIIRTVFYILTFNKMKKEIYYSRMSGILNSILGKKSWYRPPLD